MTRLFEALRKARHGGAPAPALPEALPSPFPPARPQARPAAEVPSVPTELARRSIVPLRGAVSLPEDVTREMAGLRVRLEATLTRQMPRTVMFLAAQGGEGTSSVTAQFARSLAANERLRVLLVDAHARRPAFAADGSWLADAAERPEGAGGNGLSPAPNLDLMPVPAVVAAAGGAAPQVLKGILQAVSGDYDWILLDGPPVLESPEAAPLAQVADGAIVVARAGRTKRPVLARAVDVVNRSGGNVIGIVLNHRRLEIPEFIYRRI